MRKSFCVCVYIHKAYYWKTFHLEVSRLFGNLFVHNHFHYFPALNLTTSSEKQASTVALLNSYSSAWDSGMPQS